MRETERERKRDEVGVNLRLHDTEERGNEK